MENSNRVIKFRAWNKEKKEMIYFNEMESADITFYEMSRGECGFILLEYTGLKDNQGKEIYEGDIVKCGYDFDDIEEIIFINGGFGYGENTYDYWKNEFSHDEMEIIGNIYENPNLIKK